MLLFASEITVHSGSFFIGLSLAIAIFAAYFLGVWMTKKP